MPVNRRTFLKRLAAIPLLSAIWRFLPSSMQAALTGDAVRRVRPSDAAWPGAASCEKLKQDVGGNLIKVQSPFAACKGAAGSAECQEVIKNLQNPFYIGDQAGATQTTSASRD
ncbi:MAG: hypothetical protein WCE49_08690 [Terrimicrobiaceae bacterium]